jgi:multidrug efflux system membrane fusion protein
MMKPWLKWTVAVAVVGVFAGGISRTLTVRKAKQATAAAQAANPAQTTIELSANDVTSVTVRELFQGFPISGALKAVNSAVIKARVAGELQGLTLREGDAVKAGQVVARVEPTEYASRMRQAQEQADAARAQIDIAQRQFDNNRALVEQGFISKTALDVSSSNLAAAQANFKGAQASVEVTMKAMSDTVLRSPISGVVSQRLAQPGERVAIDGRVLEVVDLNRLELEATLTATDSLAIKVGQSAKLQIEGANQAVSAKVVRINPSAQAGSRSVLAYLALENPAGLRQGLFAQGTLGTAVQSALTVPLSSVRTDKPAPYVQTVQNGRVVHQSVVLAARGDVAGEPMVAVSGIAENVVVLRGTLGALREGTAVKIASSTVAATPGSPGDRAADSAAATPVAKTSTAR